RTFHHYGKLKNPHAAVVRDLTALLNLGAVRPELDENSKVIILSIRLEWPTEITETKFFERVKELPTAKTSSFLLD
ncbi:MAG: hypothetical protein HRU17_11755, partial [Polyangiaceae bacterium]|nr:hypothetical protein [Polyangiaceae bacterium]